MALRSKLPWHGLFFLSGACGLACQVVWTRWFALGLGHEMTAVLAVVGAFFGGLALGAWAVDGPVSRSHRPGVWYGRLCIGIGLWGAATAWLIPWVNEVALGWTGLLPSPLREWTIAFGLPFVTLLPATAAMGATLPAVERCTSALPGAGGSVATLYAANTLGAVVGTLAAAFLVLPTLGLRLGLLVFVALNLATGVAALILARGAGLGAESGVKGPRAATSPEVSGARARRPSRRRLEVTATPIQGAELGPVRLGITAFCAGALGIGYEVVGVRVLSQVLEGTVYTFAATLAVYLLGTSLGAWWYPRLARGRAARTLLAWLLAGLSLACLLGVWMLRLASVLYAGVRQAGLDSGAGVWFGEVTMAALVFAPPTVFMGAVFSLVAATARGPEGGVGRVLGLNTLGGALAPWCFGVCLLPVVGAKWTLALLALAYLALLPQAARGLEWVAALAVMGALTLPADLRFVPLIPGEYLAAYRAGIMGSAAVIGDARGQRALRVDGRFGMGGTASAFAERRQALIPLLLHPQPRRALFLGVGTGITFGAAAADPGLAAEGVELMPEIVQVMPLFDGFNARTNWGARLRLVVADARRFARVDTNRYDVIVAELFHPARDGAGTLYTREHFAAVRERLAPGGLFCQWLPLYQLDEGTLRVIVRTFLTVFPQGQGYWLRFNLDTPVLGLVGTLTPRHYPADWFPARAGSGAWREAVRAADLSDAPQLFGCLAADADGLRRFARGAALNTDVRQVVTFGAPRFFDEAHLTSYGRLFALLDRATPDPTGLFVPGPDGEALARRVKKFIAARDTYLHGLRAQAEGDLPRGLAAFLESAGISEDFSTGYAQCLALAVQESRRHPAAARALLERLAELQPDRPVARELLDRLFK